MLKEILEEMKLPALKSREEMFAVLEKEVYGAIPPAPEKLDFTVEENVIRNFCAGKAVCNRITAHCVLNGKEFSFPFCFVLPTDGKKHPFFVMVQFRADIPDRYVPAEELVDRGFAFFSFCFKDVTSDNDDFTNGLAGLLYENGSRPNDTDCGKISMWAWAAMRVMDYASTRGDVLDLERGTVCGHSRLGKTALWTSANDPRFAFAYSNDSGCGGASLARGNEGETVDAICNRFSYWFCKNYQKYRNNEENMPFDQHYLIASIAPRKVLVGSAAGDAWADPKNEFLACVAASPAFSKGLVSPDRLPETGETFLEGDLGYQIRPGLHYFSRQDWNRLADFILLHSEK